MSILVEDYMRNGLIQNKVFVDPEMLGVQLLYIYLDCYERLKEELVGIVGRWAKEEKEKPKKDRRDKAKRRVLQLLIQE